MSPIAGLAVAFAAGIAAGLRVAQPDIAAACALAAAFLILKTWLLGGRHAAAVAFALIGACSGIMQGVRARSDCRTQIPDGAHISVTGVFDGHVAADTSSFLIVEEVRVSGRSFPCRGAVRVRVPARVLKPVAGGTHVRVDGRWWAVPAARGWPVPPERSGSLAVSALRATRVSHRDHVLLRIRAHAQQRVRTRFGGHAGLAESLLLARREGLDPEVRSRFAAAGMAHLLAISGMHVGILAAVLLLLARVVRLSHRRSALFAVGGTLAYVVFLGAPWAAARAALQAVLLLSSRLTQRPADAVGLLAATATLLLAVDPLALLDAGFQLSFAGMWGIIALRKPLLAALPESGPHALRDAMATSLAAMLVTAPIAALHFGQAAIIGLVANLVATPLLGLAVPALALTLLSDAASATAAVFIAGGASLLLAGLDSIAAFAAAVPGGHFAVSTTGLTAALLGALGFVLSGHLVPDRTEAWRHRMRRDGRARGRLLALRLMVALAIWYAWPALSGRGTGTVEIHAIDVGQGDAFAIRSPAGRWILVDVGPRSETFDAGRARVVPFLLRHGVRRIDAILLTHPHADHIGGLAAVLDVFPVGLILDPSVPAGESLYAETIAAARRHRVPWFAGRAGRELALDGMTVRVLSPADSLLDARDDPNDYSVVFHLAYGRFGALFLGDAPRSVENRLVAEYGTAIASGVIKIGHHGSRTSTGDSVLDGTGARIALVPVGRRNRYGHPSADVVARLTRHGVQVLRTDLSGSIVVRARLDGSVSAGVAR